MRWEDEQYVKIYTRDTPEFLALTWQARCLLHEIIRKVDRAGILKVGKLGLRGVAVAVRAPWDELEPPLRELLDNERIRFDEQLGAVLVPNHIEAQGARQSDRARQQKSRDQARASMSQDVTESSHGVTPGHTESHDVTIRSDQIRSEEKRSEKIPQISGRPEWMPNDPMGDDGLRGAWAAGAAHGRGKPTSKPTGGQVKAILAAVEAHAPGACKAASAHGERETWVRDTAAAWGKTNPPDPSVWAWQRWLDSGRVTRAAARADAPPTGRARARPWVPPPRPPPRDPNERVPDWPADAPAPSLN